MRFTERSSGELLMRDKLRSLAVGNKGIAVAHTRGGVQPPGRRDVAVGAKMDATAPLGAHVARS